MRFLLNCHHLHLSFFLAKKKSVYRASNVCFNGPKGTFATPIAYPVCCQTNISILKTKHCSTFIVLFSGVKQTMLIIHLTPGMLTTQVWYYSDITPNLHSWGQWTALSWTLQTNLLFCTEKYEIECFKLLVKEQHSYIGQIMLFNRNLLSFSSLCCETFWTLVH